MRKNIVFIFLSFICSCSTFSQTIVNANREANFVNYNAESGFDYVNTFQVFEDSKGYAWFCAKEGISRFDGINFKNFTLKDGLPSVVITSACEDNSGRLWICSSNGFAIFKNNRFDTAVHLHKALFMKIMRANDGTIWAAGNLGLYHFDPTNTEKPFLKNYQIKEKVNNSAFRNVWQNKKGEIMGGGEAGCFIIKNDSLVRYNDVEGPVYTMIDFNNGTEWFTGWDRPISVYKNGKAEKSIPLGSAALDMIQDAKGNVWLATWDKGIFKYDGKKFINYSAKQGLSFSSFWGIDVDSGGNIWLSSWGKGVFKYSGEAFTRLSEKSGLPSNTISGFTEMPDKTLWLSTEQSLSSYNSQTGEIKTIDKCNNEKLSLIVSLYAHSANELWALGYVGNGYKVIDGKISIDKDLTGFNVLKDSRGDVWIGTDKQGVIKISGNQKTFIDVNKVQPSNRVTGIMEDSRHNYWWFNDDKGISFYDNKTVKNFNTSNGFVNELATALTEDNKGYYWFSVPTRGVFKCSLDAKNSIKILDSITVKEGLVMDNVSSLTIVNNVLFIGTKYGLCEMKLEGYYQTNTKKLRYYNKEDGLLNPDCRIFASDSLGNLWLNTSGGLYVYNPSLYKPNKKETRTYITGIKLFFDEVNWLNHVKEISEDGLPINLKLSHTQNHLTFGFVGINHSAPGKVQYIYRMAGLDKNWSPAINKTEAGYSNIPPGTYTFMVKSCNNEGLWNAQPQTFIFTINPPFWKTTWFYTVCLIGILLLLFLFIKSREKKLKREKLILEQRVQLRTHELKKALGQIEEKNKEITDSINYAGKIQAAILPNQEDIGRLSADFFVIFKPKDIVSGDFYWAEQRGDKFYLAVCDSTGHGVPGAFMSLLNLSFINEALNEKNIATPNEIFNHVRSRLINSISKEGQKDGFDGTLVCFDKANKKLMYSAANTKPILLSNGVTQILSADKMPVGKGERQESFVLHEINYQSGDVLYLFTDGYADQFGGQQGKKFKFKQLEETIVSLHKMPMAEQESVLNLKFEKWKDALEQVDDVCMIGIRL
jgi:ligand-binding sensor domain-containing protein/serine phosphatase RsbU (regulator of sigma subunit)